MTKIMLVEDDNNLREIYEARLTAEGYTIVSAQDGEAALALAAKERPDLIITDVMMPKISGFEMLDILRNTENLKDVKVIMLTALGQSEDNARAGALGADRYLVKSQVTLEDIIKATHEVLEVSAEPTADPAVSSSIPETASAEPPMVGAAELSVEPSLTAIQTEPAIDAAAFMPQPIEIIEPPQANEQLDATDDVSAGAPEHQAAAEAEVASAVPVAQEESEIKAQIEDFLANSTVASDSTATEASATPPPDEAESEYAKDATTPDMGQLAVHDAPVTEAAPAQPTAPPVASATPANSYPSQTYQLPVVPEAAIDGAAVAQQTPPQSPSDRVVSDAINDMVASTIPQSSTPAGTALVDATPAQNPQLPAAAADPTAQSESSETGPATAPFDDGDNGGVHKLVIAPLNLPSKPDINQLLAMEEAKTAAAQAASATSQPIAAPTAVAIEPTSTSAFGGSEPQPAQPTASEPTPAIQPGSAGPAANSSNINSIAL